jgi:deazaflavin-dependent oxidoreductase (nitroreductase family)
VGIIKELKYEVPQPNAAQRAMWHISSSRAGSWFFARTLPHVDRLALQLSRGRVTLAGLTSGVPVLTITTTGVRSGLRRTTPLLGVPFGDDIAIIGTHFGQSGTPGWYYNLRAEPRVEVTFHGTSVTATAREADASESSVIWEQARKIYAGYEMYARRIKDRRIRIMVLST